MYDVPRLPPFAIGGAVVTSLFLMQCLTSYLTLQVGVWCNDESCIRCEDFDKELERGQAAFILKRVHRVFQDGGCVEFSSSGPLILPKCANCFEGMPATHVLFVIKHIGHLHPEPPSQE